MSTNLPSLTNSRTPDLLTRVGRRMSVVFNLNKSNAFKDNEKYV